VSKGGVDRDREGRDRDERERGASNGRGTCATSRGMHASVSTDALEANAIDLLTPVESLSLNPV
jgi:hypothetical protein